MTQPSLRPPGPADQPPARPPDVDTGFWLWLAAVPLLSIGYLLDNLVTPPEQSSLFLRGMAVLILVVVVAIVVTMLFLLRSGYRWVRTLLSAGGFGSIAYTITNLFTVHRDSAPAAFGYAATTIIGCVLVGGGIFLLHRKDANGFFTR